MLFDAGILLEAIRGMVGLVAMVSDNKTFPKPFDRVKEREYLERLRDGDKEAGDKLIEHNLRLVAHISKKFHGSKLEHDDLITIGTIGLIKAVRSFKLDKGTQLATYAARCIENEIRMTLRSEKKLRNNVSYEEPIGTDNEGNSIALIDILGTDPEAITNQVDLNIKITKMRKFINSSLPARERNIIIMRYGLDDGVPKTQRQIAGMLGISRSYVSRIEKKAVSRLNKLI